MTRTYTQASRVMSLTGPIVERLDLRIESEPGVPASGDFRFVWFDYDRHVELNVPSDGWPSLFLHSRDLVDELRKLQGAFVTPEDVIDILQGLGFTDGHNQG